MTPVLPDVDLTPLTRADVRAHTQARYVEGAVELLTRRPDLARFGVAWIIRDGAVG